MIISLDIKLNGDGMRKIIFLWMICMLSPLVAKAIRMPADPTKKEGLSPAEKEALEIRRKARERFYRAVDAVEDSHKSYEHMRTGRSKDSIPSTEHMYPAFRVPKDDDEASRKRAQEWRSEALRLAMEAKRDAEAKEAGEVHAAAAKE